MNESGSLDGYFIFYRSNKFVFKKKLDVFEHRANDIILRSVFSNEKTTAMVTQGCSSISFPIENRELSYDFHYNRFVLCSKSSNFF